MGAVIGIFRGLKPWQVGGLIAALAVIIIAIYGASTIFGGTEQPGPLTGEEAVGAQVEPTVREIPVNGSLVFPHRVELTFDTSGDVGEVLVQEGDRVTRGQVLARLDDLSVTALEKALAEARLDLDLAQEELEEAREEFDTTPLEQAEFQDSIAQATKALDDAEEKLADFQRDYQTDLATATKAKADAESKLDAAIESLEDFQRTYQSTLAFAMQFKAEAEIVLDDALEQVGYFDRDQVQDVADARKKVADKDLALEFAREDLDSFEADFDESVADALFDKGTAEILFEAAEDDLKEFLFNPTLDTDSGEAIDIAALRRCSSCPGGSQDQFATD